MERFARCPLFRSGFAWLSSVKPVIVFVVSCRFVDSYYNGQRDSIQQLLVVQIEKDPGVEV